jgi:hypothetical protein
LSREKRPFPSFASFGGEYRSYRESNASVSRSMTPARAALSPATTVSSSVYLIAVLSFSVRNSARSVSIGVRWGSTT